MSIDKKNISILGSGPSGMAAAIHLKNNGYNVTVFEQKDCPGFRFNNGWQILENYSSKIDALEELKMMNIDPDFFYKAVSEIDFFDSKLRNYHLRGNLPFGYFVKRGGESDALDSALHRQAEKAGVKIEYKKRIEEANADIIAGGSRYASGVSKEVVFETNIDDIFLTILDDYISPYGFSYLFVINGRGTIGTAILKDFKNIDKYSEFAVLRYKQIVDLNIDSPVESVSSVGFFLPVTAVMSGKYYVGEAAGFQDYLFGLGIRRSIQTGYLAAKSIIEDLNYDKLWKDHIGRQLLSGIFNRHIVEKIGNRGYSFLLRIANRMDFQKLGQRLQNPSMLRILAATLIMRSSKLKDQCKHGPRCAWCRSSN